MAINFDAFKKLQNNNNVQQTKATNTAKETQKAEQKQMVDTNIFKNVEDKVKDVDIDGLKKLIEEFLEAGYDVEVTEEVDEFEEMDADGDGVISKEEYDNYQNQKLADTFRDYDFDGDGKISPEEAARFAEMDLNGDGKISDFERGYYEGKHANDKPFIDFPSIKEPFWKNPFIKPLIKPIEEPIHFTVDPGIFTLKEPVDARKYLYE